MTISLSNIRHFLLIIGCLTFLNTAVVFAQPMFSVSQGYVSITDEALVNVDGDIYLNVNTVIFNEDTIRNQGIGLMKAMDSASILAYQDMSISMEKISRLQVAQLQDFTIFS